MGYRAQRPQPYLGTTLAHIERLEHECLPARSRLEWGHSDQCHRCLTPPTGPGGGSPPFLPDPDLIARVVR